MKMRRFSLMVVFAVILVTCIPEDVTVAPDWTVRVVDEGGRPVSEVTVTETTQYYPFESFPNTERKFTDNDGLVHFSRRTLRLSLAARTFACVKRIAKEGIKFGCGPQATFWAEKQWYGPVTYKTDTGWDERTDPKTSVFALRKDPHDVR